MAAILTQDMNALGVALGPGGEAAAARLFDQVGNNNVNLGAVNGTGVTGKEYVTGIVKQTVITLTNVSITMTDGGANGSIGSLKVYDLPAGLIRIHGARTNLTVTAASGIGATAALKHSLGTAAAATNDTLNLTKANIIPSTSTTLASSAGSPKGVSAATAITALTDNSGGTASDTLAAITGSYVEATIENTVASLAAKINALIAANTLVGNGLALVVDGTSSAADVYLNFGVADADSTANSTLTVNGTITINWMTLATA